LVKHEIFIPALECSNWWPAPRNHWQKNRLKFVRMRVLFT